MLRLNEVERKELAGYTSDRPPAQDLLASYYKRRPRVVPFVEVDSDVLTVAGGFDLAYDASHADGGTLRPADCNRLEDLPVARVQIRSGATKAEALAALENIKAAVAGQYPS